MKIKIDRSLSMQEKAKKIIPGMTQFLSKRPDLWSYGSWPTYFAQAKGSYVWDLDGNKYIDMSVAGVGTNVLGYADSDVNEAVINIIEKGSNSTLNAPEEIELSELLINLHDWSGMVRLCRTGAEAMSIAARIVRTFKRKDKILFCGYHGWSDWYVAANLGSGDILKGHVIPGIEPIGVPESMKGTSVAFNYNDIGSLKKIVEKDYENIAGIMMEPIRNLKPKDRFLENVRDLANHYKIPLVFDEITSGFRLSTAGAHKEITNIVPDIAVFSKAMGNGHPIAAVVGTEELMIKAADAFISSTFWTEKVGTVASLATLKKHRDLNVGNHLINVGKNVRKIWKESAEKNGLKINIGGGMEPISNFTIEYKNPQALKTFFIERMLEHGFLANTLFYSMYSHTDEQLRLYSEAVDKTFSDIAFCINKNSIEDNLIGKIAISSFKRLA